MSEDSTSCGCGGCVGFLVLILVMIALIWGLSITWGTFHIDLFPPGVYLK